MFANVHLLVGYNQGSINDYLKMASYVQETFPTADHNQICCGKVFKSDSVLGYSIVTLNTYLPQGKYPGWEQRPDGKIEYSW